MGMTRENKQCGPSEIRFDEDGEVDEIIIRDELGYPIFHLERLHDKSVWMGLYSPENEKDNQVIKIGSVKPIYMNLEGKPDERSTSFNNYASRISGLT